jgi:hypothetical protein
MVLYGYVKNVISTCGGGWKIHDFLVIVQPNGPLQNNNNHHNICALGCTMIK